MKAVIMAAGKGTRMRPLTDDTPKPLLPAAGKPLMEHNIEVLEDLVDEIIIVAGYRKDAIEEYFSGENITIVEQEEALGTAHAALQAKDRIDGKTVILNGDDIYGGESMRKAIESDSAVLADRVEDASEYGVFELEDGKVKGIEEKPEEPSSDLVNIGFYVVQKDFFDLLEKVEKSERGEYEITDALESYMDIHEMDLVETDRWIPCSYPEDILEANQELLKEIEHSAERTVHREPVKIEDGAEVHEKAVLKGPVVIKSGAKIGKNAVISGSAVHEGASIESSSRLKNSVLRENSTVGECVDVQNVYVRPEVDVEETPEGNVFPAE